jgi:hypothetical protein
MESWRENQILQHQQLLNLSLTASSRPGSVLPGVGNGGMHPTTLIGSSVSPTELLGQQHSSHSRAMSISSAFGGYGSHTPLSIAPVSITPHLVPEHRGHTLSVATLQQLSLLGSNAAANAAAAGGGIGNGPTSAFSPPKHVTVTSVDLHPAARNGDASLPESQRVSPTPSMHSSASDHVGQSIESLFTSSVLRRDGGRCIVCKAGPGSTNGSGDVPVLAVHIVPPSSERTEAGLAQAKLLHCYETTNGLSLCPSCSASFELGLWYILPSDGRSLVISQALPPVQSEWLSRVGGQVSTPTTYKRQWPAPAVFSVQQHFAEAEWKAARKRYARRLAEEGQKEA